jgi:hypothetical protein
VNERRLPVVDSIFLSALVIVWLGFPRIVGANGPAAQVPSRKIVDLSSMNQETGET